MRYYLRALAAVLTGVTFLLLGNGLLSTLVALAGEVRGFNTVLLGLLSSGYFVGFFLGIWLTVPIIRRVGHIRTFAISAALAAITSLVLSLTDSPWIWLAARVVYGVAIVSTYAVIESWLTEAVPSDARSRMFAVYTMVTLGASALAQQLLGLASPAGFTLFVLTAILLCLALIPVAMTRLPQPDTLSLPDFNLKAVWQAAPLALITAGFAGMLMGAFWGLMPLYGSAIGMTPQTIGWLMTAAIVGGALGQLPIGYYSDRRDRRKVLTKVMVAGAASSILLIPLGSASTVFVVAGLWGAMAFCIYPIAIAYMVDRVSTEFVVSGASGVLMLFGVGAAIGPLVAGGFMNVLGATALPGYFAVVLLVLYWILYRSINTHGSEPATDHEGHYAPIDAVHTLVSSNEDTLLAEDAENSAEPEFQASDGTIWPDSSASEPGSGTRTGNA